jgi:hypothetical protein
MDAKFVVRVQHCLFIKSLRGTAINVSNGLPGLPNEVSVSTGKYCNERCCGFFSWSNLKCWNVLKGE